jgi:hypothetical protein
MEKTMPSYKVINRYGVPWANRFVTENGAWSRLLALKRMSNTAENRMKLMAQGWLVRQAQRIQK